MKRNRFISGLFAIMLACGAQAEAESVVSRLLDSYASVQSLSCELRRDTSLPDGETLRMLSRIYYQQPDKLHVENFSPIKRRILSDGAVFRSYTQGAPKGFSRPVNELNQEMLINLRMLPGSNANLLEALRDLTEIPLEPTKDFPTRVGYDNAGRSFTVLSLDAEGRWCRMEVFGSQAMNDRSVDAVYSHFQEIKPGVWLACRQESKLAIQGLHRTETVRIDAISAETALPASLFDSAPFFKGVEFVDSFEKIAP
ncbi:MAG: hypothetical protein LBN38_04715 [Verrucomicrobiota bacterium]|jgi:outer membrane lipoprotein-sorting protein|nr:hypothetical protein [Verrucomicrobiota bacterium]